MSANEWWTCPQCSRNSIREGGDGSNRLTGRVDYEIYMADEDGSPVHDDESSHKASALVVDFGFECQECGFAKSFKEVKPF